MNVDLKNYIKKWELAEQKPQNEDEFITLFLEYLKDYELDLDLDFHGDGAYFGKQITIGESNRYTSHYAFEIAYSKESLRIYTSAHHGFWTAEFVDLTFKDDKFKEIIDALFKRVKGIMNII